MSEPATTEILVRGGRPFKRIRMANNFTQGKEAELENLLGAVSYRTVPFNELNRLTRPWRQTIYSLSARLSPHRKRRESLSSKVRLTILLN